VSRGGERRRQAQPPALDRGVAVSTFLPDRLELVKGPPGSRRRRLDRCVAALRPARADLRTRYGRALAQRNALISRIRAGAAPAADLAPWDAELAEEGIALMDAREAASAALRDPFREAAADLGLPSADLRYRPRSAASSAAELTTELERHRDADLRRGYSGHGPHMDELELSLGGRQVRRFGSQGQQRATLLALLFAERAALVASGAPAPPMLLDDVMSELDPGCRRLLARRLERGGQAIVTATERDQVPAECHPLAIEVGGGRVVEPQARAA
jgi:DNA replication and repair protein RecF